MSKCFGLFVCCSNQAGPSAVIVVVSTLRDAGEGGGQSKQESKLVFQCAIHIK